MQPSDSLPPVGRGSSRPWPVAYPVPRATRRKKGLPGAWAVLFQRAVGSDPAGCASRLAHRVETAIAFRLHNALGTQNERYFVAVNPTAHSLACLRIGVFVTADAARLATGVGGSPFTGRVSHPLDGKQSFMTSPHRHSPLTSLAWSHCAPTPLMRIPGPTHRGPILLQHRREHLQARGHDQLLELGLGIDKDVDQREMTRCRGCRLATTSDYARLLLHGGSFLGASPQVFPTGRITRPAGSRRLKFQQPLGHPQHRPVGRGPRRVGRRETRGTRQAWMEEAPSRCRPVGGDRGAGSTQCAWRRRHDYGPTTTVDLSPVGDGDISSVTADAVYDTTAVCEAAGGRGAKVVVPPKRTAAVSHRRPRSGARDRTVKRAQAIGRRCWKKEAGSHRQARVENVFFRYTSIIGDGLRARRAAGQGAEAVLACHVLNRMRDLGRPASYAIRR